MTGEEKPSSTALVKLSLLSPRAFLNICDGLLHWKTMTHCDILPKNFIT